MLLHLIEREEALLLDSTDDGALLDAVAAADFGIVAHRRSRTLALVANVADHALTEQQMIADLADILGVLEQLEVPRAIGRVAVEHAANQLVVLDDQLLVNATGRVVEDDFLKAIAGLATHVIAGGEQVDAGDLELGRSDRAGVAADAVVGQMVGRDLGLLEQRRNQAVGDAAVGDAFANGVDLRVVGLQRVVHHDATVAVDAGGFSQRRVRADAGGHHHQLGRDLHAVLEADGGNAAGFAGDQRFGLLFEQEGQAAVFERLLQHLAGDLIELTLKQPGAEMHDSNVHAAQLEAVGGFEAEQAAADNDGVLVLLGRVYHRIGIGDVAVTDDAFQVVAGDRQHEGVGAGGQQQAVVRFDRAVFGDDLALDAVDLRNLLAEVQVDLVLAVPVVVVEDDVLHLHLAGQHRRKQDAVVVGVRLGAEDRHVVHIRRDSEEFFEGAHTRHAVADHHQFGFAHVATPCDFDFHHT